MNNLSGHIRLDFRSTEPLYLQIAGQIEQMVARGELKMGDQLPTVRELATELRINFNTVARAYRLLDEARLISTQRGRGTYIWEEPDADTLDQIRHHRLEEMARRYLEESHRLGFSASEALGALHALLRPSPSDPSRPFGFEADQHNEPGEDLRPL
ncbi:MAG: GntR family transcriptional regulator [Anaerolineae bacterium]|nr:GntR family transcriptional regulator [Anaerolineae bacterium]